MNIVKVAAMLGELTLLRYFPSDPSARDAIVREVGCMASEEKQVRWLVSRMLTVYREWPGLMEMRACFCNRFKPTDGREAYSEIFLSAESWPEDPTCTLPALPAAPTRLLEGASADPEMSAVVDSLAAKVRRLPSVRPTRHRDGEDDFQGLMRAMEEARALPPRINTGPLERALKEDTERIIATQAANRKELGRPA